MNSSLSEAANRISRALISASNRSIPTRTWTPSLEQTLHRLGCRDSLTPSLVRRVIDPLLLNHHSLALGFFNWASQQPGFSHTHITYQAILKSLSISRNFNAVENLLKQVRAKKIDLDPSVYRSIIASQIISKRTLNAFSIFNEVCSLNYDLGAEVCNSLLAALSAEGFSGYARMMLDKMTMRDVEVSTLGFGVFIWRFCRNAEVGETLDLLDKVRRGFCGTDGSIIAVLIVHGLCSESRVSDALWILDELRRRDCKPDFMAYRIVAEGFRLMGNVIDVELALKKKRKLGVAPRSSDYRQFIFALISERLIWEAKELGEIIVSGNFPIEDDVLNALVTSVSAVYPDSAMLFFKFMINKERFPTLLTVSNLCKNLCKHSKINELLEVFELLCVKEYFLDEESYNVMVSFLCKAGKVQEAYEVLKEMKKKGCNPDVSFYNYIMEACCRDGLLRPAKRLWDEMFASGCDGNLTTYNILISKFSETGQVEEARRLFCHMTEKGVIPDVVTYKSLLQGLCKEKKLKDAIEVFNKSVEQDAQLAQKILSSCTLHLCKEGHFQAASMLLCGLTSDVGQAESHVVFLKFLLEAADVPAAIEHIKSIRGNSELTLARIYSELRDSLTTLSKPEPMLQMLQVVQEKCMI